MHRMKRVEAPSKRWAGALVAATWIVAIVAGGVLDQEGQHRASRFLAGAAAATVGAALLRDWQGVSRDAAASSARWWARWRPLSMGWQRSPRWQLLLLRVFGAFAALVGIALFLSGFAN